MTNQDPTPDESMPSRPEGLGTIPSVTEAIERAVDGVDPEAAAIERATGVGADAPDEADIEQLLFRAREREFITSGEIFAAFQDADAERFLGSNDVKYHLGQSGTFMSRHGAEIEVDLAANPSHLEIVNPVVEGKARARQRIRGATGERWRVLPLLIHGDAAFAGQGVVAETLNFSQLPGYQTGGTLHIVCK